MITLLILPSPPVLGPVMVKNPWWACRILAQIADRKGLSYTGPAMEEFDLEYASLKAVKEYLVLKQEKQVVNHVELELIQQEGHQVVQNVKLENIIQIQDQLHHLLV